LNASNDGQLLSATIFDLGVHWKALVRRAGYHIGRFLGRREAAFDESRGNDGA
jgi:hypothetical protein